MKVIVQIINSFSINGTGGNPAGVVIDADALTAERKQLIAFKAGLSETAFVSKSTVADFKLEFFTPNRQIAHCGHATIATFWLLNSLGRITGTESSKETIDGTRRIFFREGRPFMEQLAPKFTAVGDEHEVLKSIGVEQGVLRRDRAIVIGNTGTSFLLIGLRDEQMLQKLVPDVELITALSSKYDCIGYYVYALPDDGIPQTRMFAPLYGINEESATGMAAGPLAGLLYSEIGLDKFSIRQGKYMQPSSESRIDIEIFRKDRQISSLLAGGTAYINKTLELTI